MSPLVLLLMTSCPVAIDAAQAPEPRFLFSRDGNEQPAPDPNNGGRHSFFSRFRGWFHRSSHGNDNQVPGDWGGKAVGYPPAANTTFPPSSFPAGTTPAPVHVPTTAEPPLASPILPGR